MSDKDLPSRAEAPATPGPSCSRSRQAWFARQWLVAEPSRSGHIHLRGERGERERGGWGRERGGEGKRGRGGREKEKGGWERGVGEREGERGRGGEGEYAKVERGEGGEEEGERG